MFQKKFSPGNAPLHADRRKTKTALEYEFILRRWKFAKKTPPTNNSIESLIDTRTVRTVVFRNFRVAFALRYARMQFRGARCFYQMNIWLECILNVMSSPAKFSQMVRQQHTRISASMAFWRFSALGGVGGCTRVSLTIASLPHAILRNGGFYCIPVCIMLA